MLSTFKKVFPYILVGVGIGALIHNWIPGHWIEAALGSNNPFGVILATLVGIPMYADILAQSPLEALLYKGAQLSNDFVLYDGCYYIKSAVYDYVEKAV